MELSITIAALIAAASLSAAPTTRGAAAQPLEGVYKSRVTITMPERRPYTVEDVLELVPVASGAYYFRAHTEHAAGNACDIWGIARLKGATLAFSHAVAGSAKSPCTFTLRLKDRGISLEDLDDACRPATCGPRASWGSTEPVQFTYAARRPIRYLERLKRSHEYAWAQAEFKGRTPPSDALAAF